jgi:hypothetical protein
MEYDELRREKNEKMAVTRKINSHNFYLSVSFE